VLGEGTLRGGRRPRGPGADHHRLALVWGSVRAQTDVLRALGEGRVALLVEAERREARGSETACEWGRWESYRVSDGIAVTSNRL
jgi:hypothetical protein